MFCAVRDGMGDPELPDDSAPKPLGIEWHAGTCTNTKLRILTREIEATRLAAA